MVGDMHGGGHAWQGVGMHGMTPMHGGGHVWQEGRWGHMWQGGMHGKGHVWQEVCMVAGGMHGGGTCMVAGGGCVVAGGHAWQGGGMHGMPPPFPQQIL